MRVEGVVPISISLVRIPTYTHVHLPTHTSPDRSLPLAFTGFTRYARLAPSSLAASLFLPPVPLLSRSRFMDLLALTFRRPSISPEANRRHDDHLLGQERGGPRIRTR